MQGLEQTPQTAFTDGGVGVETRPRSAPMSTITSPDTTTETEEAETAKAYSQLENDNARRTTNCEPDAASEEEAVRVGASSEVESASSHIGASVETEKDSGREQYRGEETAQSSGSSQVLVDSKSEEARLTQDNAVDPYDFNNNTILISLQLLPIDSTVEQVPAERSVLVGVGLFKEAPLFEQVPLCQLPLPPLIQQMLQQLESELPQRKAAYIARVEQQKRQEEERKAALNSQVTRARQPLKKTKTERPDSAPTPPSTLTNSDDLESKRAAHGTVGGKSQLSLF